MRRITILSLALLFALAADALAADDAALRVISGGATHAFTLVELRALPATEGLGATKNTAGKVSPAGRYRGVAVKDLLRAAGVADTTADVRVVAGDGYAVTFSSAQIARGGFTVYDAAGATLAEHGPVSAVLAWERDGRPLDPRAEGTLRLVIVAERAGEVTDGHLSVRDVARLEVLPARGEWTLHLEGGLTEAIDRATFESGAAPDCHGVTWKDERGRAWTGIPLWLLVGRVDDARRHESGAYDDSLAVAGYTVEVVAADGRRASFTSERLRRNDGILLAHLLEGVPLAAPHFPLRLVGAALAKEERLGAVDSVIVRVAKAAGK